MIDLNKVGPNMKQSLIFSGALHVVVFLLIIFGFPLVAKKPPPENVPIAVQFVSQSIAKNKKTDVIKPPESKPVPPPRRKAPTMKAKKAPNLSKDKPVEPIKKEEPAPDKVAKAVPLPNQKKEKPKEPEPEKENLTKKAPDQDSQQFSSLLKNLIEEEERQPDPNLLKRDSIQKMSEKDVDSKLKDQDEALKNILNNLSQQKDLPSPHMQNVKGSSIDGRLNLTELDRVKQQLAGCWHVLSGARYAEDLTVEIKLFMNPDRTIRNAVIMDKARYGRDNLFRSAADSALRALKMPACQVLDLPPEKYDQWNTTIITFDPRDML